MITYCGHRVTAVQLAKIYVLDKGEVGTEYWQEDYSIGWSTYREHNLINAAMQQQLSRVVKLLGRPNWPSAPEASGNRHMRRPIPLPAGVEARV